MVRADILAEGAIVVCESDKDTPFEMEGLYVKRFARYSRSYLTVLVKKGDESDE